MATYASDDSIESLATSGDSSNMTAGTLIGLNHEIRTNNGHMEIRSGVSFIVWEQIRPFQFNKELKEKYQFSMEKFTWTL